MTLASACRHAFTSRTRRRGEDYFEAGKVLLRGMRSETFLLAVRGSLEVPYMVHLDFSEVDARERMKVACTCRYFFEGFMCKHIYAGLIALDAESQENAAPNILDADSFRDVRLDLVAKEVEQREQDWFFDDRFGFGDDLDEAPWERWLRKVGRDLFARGTPIDPDVVLSQARPRVVSYRLEQQRSADRDAIVVSFHQQEKNAGGLGIERPLVLSLEEAEFLPNRADRSALSLLLSTPIARSGQARGDAFTGKMRASSSAIPRPLIPEILQALARTGRFYLDSDELQTRPLEWSPETRCRLLLQGARTEEGLKVSGLLRCADERISIGDVRAVFPDGILLLGQRLVRLEGESTHAAVWISHLRKEDAFVVPAADQERFLAELAKTALVPEFEIESGLGFEHRRRTPVPHVSFAANETGVTAKVFFDYGGQAVSLTDANALVLDSETGQLTPRDFTAERSAIRQLGATGAKRADETLQIPKSRFLTAVRDLVQAGWVVQNHGRAVRRADPPELRVRSGQDWFDLDVKFDFGQGAIALPALLRAAKKQEKLVRLDDGSDGLVPDAWLERFAPLMRLGTVRGDNIRFSTSQAFLLDVLLELHSASSSADDQFNAVAQRLRNAKPKREGEPQGFSGVLRPYQQDGLGWLRYLNQLQLGGCLADDMGLGKTVQVLALLAKRRGIGKPSLVVAPKSLIYNWLEEAARFVPELNAAAYTGTSRGELLSEFAELDLIITTYGIVRRDVEVLTQKHFDYVVLDEAQMVKNPDSLASKACRLLRGDHRLALSGTPIENHIFELWALFEFLNPKMLGTKRKFADLARAKSGLDVLAKGLRPMLLRRTKGEVLSELPSKSEQTIFCELDDDHRKQYDELRAHYRQQLEKNVASEGLARAKFKVLEALLRLRQAACHPGLIDATLIDRPAAKLETLLMQIRTLIGEGHKVLVFSQFVRHLRLVEARLVAEGLSFAYLDGQSRDRQAEIRRFQETPDCSVFLISLKAGGLGLNLTAADYVFLLDPWWNPASERQAIDRAHRIGQTRPVFAYRLIAKDTVEEKILELHAKKTALADVFLSDNDRPLEGLSLDDLRGILS